MLESLTKRYADGTHRLVTPEETLERITPHLDAMGITRCADITRFDNLGVPVYRSIRPQGMVLQVGNGKGLRHIDAKVSALMEAIEVYHAEYPDVKFRRASFAQLQDDKTTKVIAPNLLPQYQGQRYFSPDYLIDWVCGENLLSGEKVWLPAGTVYLHWPSLYNFCANGLASGNHLIEATLHGLYEVIERDAISRLSNSRRLRILEICQSIDLNTVDDKSVKPLQETLELAGIKLVLFWVPSCIPIHTFWAVIIDQTQCSHTSVINAGYGTHLSTSVAATRAITDAAQSRLTLIHNARKNNVALISQESHIKTKLVQFFNKLVGDSDWRSFVDMSGDNLEQDYTKVLTALGAMGYKHVFRVILTREPFNIPVVKIIIPGMKMNDKLM